MHPIPWQSLMSTLASEKRQSQRNRANIRRLGSAFHKFHSLEPRGTPEHASDLLLSLQKTWTPTNARTYTRSLNKAMRIIPRLLCKSGAAKAQRHQGEHPIPLHETFAHTAKKGRARGMKRLPLKRCGARGTPRRAAIPWECAVSRGCHVKHREPVNELSESNSV